MLSSKWESKRQFTRWRPKGKRILKWSLCTAARFMRTREDLHPKIGEESRPNWESKMRGNKWTTQKCLRFKNRLQQIRKTNSYMMEALTYWILSKTNSSQKMTGLKKAPAVTACLEIRSKSSRIIDKALKLKDSSIRKKRRKRHFHRDFVSRKQSTRKN